MKKGLCITLSLMLCILSFNSIKADELTDAQKKMNNINGSINDKKDTLNEINKQRSDTQANINELDKKMTASSNNLGELNNKLSALSTQIGTLNTQIDESNNSLNEEKELFKKRVRAMYISGNEGYLELLLTSKDFSDFLSRMDTVVKLMDYDNQLISTIETKSKALALQKSELNQKKTETTVVKQQADSNLKELQDSSDKKKELMTSLEKDKVSYEKMIEQEQKESQQIAQIIKTIQAQREAAKNKPNNGGSNGPVLSGNSSSIGKLYCVTGKPALITSPYGWRVHPVLGTKKFHAGIDLGVSSGTPIYALADGVVIYSGWMEGYGNVVMINHGSLTSLYGHNSSLAVKVGQAVKGGQLISYSGNTGLSSGPHLHFEMRKANGDTTDPNPYYVK
ncbi:murein hydrolase activator EnvC family protein [Candidatus Clostridium radicumherbarum]|uniref:Murein hydrolase activator EnvC family protein n=1 Tax=Candidatus Clostridium radicumherbarum TaxID=3381662 RepID=A0ABW8TUU7_9CLOT